MTLNLHRLRAFAILLVENLHLDKLESFQWNDVLNHIGSGKNFERAIPFQRTYVLVSEFFFCLLATQFISDVQINVQTINARSNNRLHFT